MANYMRGGWKLRQILKMTPMIVLKDTSSGFCALANSDNHGTWQTSFAVYSKHRNVTRKTVGTVLALGTLKIFLSTSIPVLLLTQASLAAINYSSTERDAAMNATHRVELTGLNPATVYWAYVSSADAKGNLTNTLANPLSFTTAAAPDETAPAISNIQITGITDSEAVISWETNESGDSFVEYGVDTGFGSTSGQEEGKTAHSVKLAGLKGNTLYHFLVKSKDISGNIGQSANQSFTTSAGPTNIPPKISAEGPRVEDLKPVSAKILWKTDKPSSSIVAFGKNINYGTEIGNTEELITEHEVQLIGLDPDTKYRFKVKSADSDGNIGESSDKEFATPEKPIISKVASSEVGLASAIITWETSTSITSEIEYGKTVAYGKNIIDQSLSQTTQHTVKIVNLESGIM
ncbi:MAG: Fibronectin type III domain protein, partial [Candidatus Magasanikbacteria bacterium GW2011_GWA2_46_17]